MANSRRHKSAKVIKAEDRELIKLADDLIKNATRLQKRLAAHKENWAPFDRQSALRKVRRTLRASKTARKAKRR